MKSITNYLIVLSLLLLVGCVKTRSNKTKTKEAEVLTIDYKVPQDLKTNTPTQKDLATFAWNEFFALNWQASFPTGKRTQPDITWDLKKSKTQPSLSVWETYFHKNELIPTSGFPLKYVSDSLPKYGYVDPVDYNGITTNKFWNNLDEDNEIGSCYLFEVDATDQTKSEEVLYMAKTNLDEYNYLSSFSTFAKLSGAIKNSVTYYDSLLKKSKSVPSDKGFSLPAGSISGDIEGAIEIKTAWRKLKEEDEAKKYFTKEALYYKHKVEGDTNLLADTAQFILLGMHIIHKTEKFPAFVFASFEHEDLRNGNYQFIGSDVPLSDGKPDTLVDEAKLQPVIPRSIAPDIAAVNKAAKTLITSQNDSSVWQYYQLIGVQATPINYVDRNLDPNYFMANYVIESDSLLTFFHGSFGDPFNESLINVYFKGETFNMGGCQGCHGQAQVNFGQDFSFIVGAHLTQSPDYSMSVDQALDSAHVMQIGSLISDLKNDLKEYRKK